MLPKMCETCGTRPEAKFARRYCYECKPGRKGEPGPCRRCGSRENYYAAGLCSRCHIYAPPPPREPCQDCEAWSVARTHAWRCGGCNAWRGANPTVATCVGCHRDRHVNRHQACRLCWRQAKATRDAGYGLDVVAANRHGQQLFFANMHSQHTRRQKVRPTTTPERVRSAGSRPRIYIHQYVFQTAASVGAARYFGFPPPPDPALAAMLDLQIQDHGRRFGWSKQVIRKTRTATRVLLGMRERSDGPIPFSEVLRLVPLKLPARPVLTVLAEVGMLEDDRIALIEPWFDRHVAGLPETMEKELRIWFEVLHHGSTTPPRKRPRTTATIKNHVLWAMPTLREWAADGHESLREITRDDVLAVLPGSGTPRATVGSALHSIFTTLKERKTLFVNPTSRIEFGSFERRIPLPADPAFLQEALDSDDLSRAALAALTVFHGLRPVELRVLQLTDVYDGRVHLADRTIPLARPAKERLARYLAYRAKRWPNSANPHFFITYQTAPTTRPTTAVWVNRRLGMSAQAIRRSRMVDEAIATRGNVRLIADFFGVTIQTAEYYTAALEHPGLLDGAAGAYSGSLSQGPR